MFNSESLKAFRIAQGLTQQDFADAIGVTRELLSKMESGKKSISKATQILLSNYASKRGEVNKVPPARIKHDPPLVGTMYEPPSEDYNRDWKGKYFTSLEENNKVLQKAVDSQAEAISTLSKVALNSGRFQKAVELNTLMINSLQEFVTTRFSEVEQREISDVGEELGNVVLRQAKEQKTGNEKRKGTVRS